MSHRGGGRGEYYRNKYGGGGRGRGGGGGGGGYGGRGGPQQASPPDEMDTRGASSGPVRSAGDLQAILRRIDGAGYGAYRDMEGAFDFGGGSTLPFRLFIDRVQSDPFAPPSRMRAVIQGNIAGFPADSYSNAIRKVALADYLTRTFVAAAREAGDDQRTESGGWSGKKGGEISMEVPGQHVLARTSTLVSASDGSVEARFTVALPARGRNIEGQWCARILLDRVPALLAKALLYRSLNAEHLRAHILSVEDQETLRSLLPEAGAVAFVRNGAILPRLGGNSDQPMPASEAVKFQSPPSLEREVRLPNSGPVRGMVIPRGISLIVGGGFHGKSTLLEALQVGMYNHVPGDGREFVCVDPTAVKIRAEDGRSVTQVNISPYIDNLPFNKTTHAFSTQDASGSTSQAANIIEALEVGSTLLLMDEDTSATNFLIRDLRMQMLVAKEKEPITPFISKVRAMYEQLGVSTIMVIGGSGDYFDVADYVIAMDQYQPSDKTAEAKAISERFASGSNGLLGVVQSSTFGSRSVRYPLGPSLQCSGKIVARGKEKLQFGDDHEVDLGAVEQLVEVGQTRAIGLALRLLGDMIGRGESDRGVRELLEALEARLDGSDGLDALEPGSMLGTLARPRRFEMAAALGRFRALGASSKVVAPS